MTYKQHELSATFPPMPADEFAELVKDIAKRDLQQSITLYQGKVLDGWHRYNACLKAGKNPRFTDYKGSDPVAFVRSANLHRRSLSPGQRALIEVELNNWAPGGRPQVKTETRPNGPVSAPAKTNAQMAKASGVGEMTIKRAKTVAANGSPEVKAAVRSGKVSVDAAAKVASLPKAQQAKAIAKPAKKKAAPKKKIVTDGEEQQLGALRRDHEELQEKHDHLVDELKAVESLRADKHVVEIMQLKAYLKDAQRRRDELMEQCRQMRAQINHWKKLAQGGKK